MKQSIMTAPGKIEFREVEKPEINDNELLLQTKRIGVCGSDIHVFHGLHPYTSYPVIQGHEISGTLAAVGKNVKGYTVGDKVTFTPQVTCGECYPCKNGMYHICEQLKVMGFQTDGAAQEYFVLPEWNALKLPDNFSLDHGAFVEPIAVGIHAISKGGGAQGKKVLVLGAGTIGNLVAQVAKASGASAVMITDINDYKLEKAKESGIEFTVNSAKEDLSEAIFTHFGPAKADLILECVGVQGTVDQAVENARKGTTIVIVGVFGKKPTVNLGFVQDRELHLVGTAMYQKSDFETAIKFISSKKMHLGNLITHRFSFQEYLDAYQTIEESGGAYMKVMVDL